MRLGYREGNREYSLTQDTNVARQKRKEQQLSKDEGLTLKRRKLAEKEEKKKQMLLQKKARENVTDAAE